MKNKFSIIVPVYNGESHIKKCIDTLLKQTYNDFEIIIINDGSTDDTKSVLTKFYAKNLKVKIVNTSNKGVSFARNLGINQSSGQYLLFVDADDELSINALKYLSIMLNKKDRDLILFGFSLTGDNNRKNDTSILKSIANQNTDCKMNILKSILSTKNNILGYVWRAVYSLDFIKKNNIFFETHLKISEDYLFLLQSVEHSNNLFVITEEFYKYNLGETSMSNKFVPTLLNDMVWVNNWIESNILTVYPQFFVGFNCLVANTYIRYVQNAIRNKEENFMLKYREIKLNKRKYNFQRSINQVIFHLDKFDFKSKIGVILFRIHLDIVYELLFNIKERKN